jgi:hypothetical protein
VLADKAVDLPTSTAIVEATARVKHHLVLGYTLQLIVRVSTEEIHVSGGSISILPIACTIGVQAQHVVFIDSISERNELIVLVLRAQRAELAAVSRVAEVVSVLEGAV